jgi:hypothetical protein
MIQEQKRINQVQETLKNFANISIWKIKQAISSNQSIDEVKNLINYLIIKNDDLKDNIFILLLKNKFDYDKYKFYKNFPDQKNLKEWIDNYIIGIRNLINDNEKLKLFCNEVKSTFDWKSIPDFKRLHKTPFYQFYKYFDTNIKNILKLKKWYSSVMIWYIKDLFLNWDIDLVWVEDNIIIEWQTGTEKKYFWTANHPVFLQWLINKLWCIVKKNDKEKNIYQFTYIEKQSNYNKYKDKNNWIIYFVDKNNTSKKCPKCIENWYENNWLRIKWWDYKKEGYNKLNQENKNFIDSYMKNHEKVDCVICEECWFNTLNGNNIAWWIIFEDWDEVACFNIAYKIVKNLLKN